MSHDLFSQTQLYTLTPEMTKLSPDLQRQSLSTLILLLLPRDLDDVYARPLPHFALRLILDPVVVKLLQ